MDVGFRVVLAPGWRATHLRRTELAAWRQSSRADGARLAYGGASPTCLHNVGISRNQRQLWGSASKTLCKCTCRRGSGPSAPARARFMGLIGCTRVLCRAVSWSSGMPDDNSEARALCARRQCSRAAGSQQSSRARSERSQRAALRPRPAPCVACPPAFLAPVGRLRSRAHAGKRCSAHYRANTVPSPLACMHSGAGREMMRVGAAAARMAGAAPAAATRLQARGRPTRWRLAGGTSGVAIFQSVMRVARVDVGVGVGWQDESYP